MKTRPKARLRLNSYVFTVADKGCKITRLRLGDLTSDRVTGFLRHLELDRSSPRQGADIGADQVKQSQLMTT